jgi:hypothetical protein
VGGVLRLSVGYVVAVSVLRGWCGDSQALSAVQEPDLIPVSLH